jgi:putative transcriptional regulator
MSQEELARLAGVSRQTISAIENRSYSPSVKLALTIARCLEKDVNELFFLVETE